MLQLILRQPVLTNMQQILLPSMQQMLRGTKASGSVCSCLLQDAVPCLTDSSCHCYILNDIGKLSEEDRSSILVFALEKVVEEHWGNRKGIKCHSPKRRRRWPLIQYDFCYDCSPQTYPEMSRSQFSPCCRWGELESIPGKWKLFFSLFPLWHFQLIFIQSLCLTETIW